MRRPCQGLHSWTLTRTVCLLGHAATSVNLVCACRALQAMSDAEPLSAKLASELRRANRAVDEGLWRHDSLADALSAAGGTKIRFNYSCTPKVPDEAAGAELEAVGDGETAQHECVRNVQRMIDLLRANLPPQDEAWSAALAELHADEVTLRLLLFGKEGLGTPWHVDRADAFNIAFALSKDVRTTMSSLCLSLLRTSCCMQALQLSSQ